MYMAELGRASGAMMGNTRNNVDEMRRRERLQQILQKELEKDSLSNKVRVTSTTPLVNLYRMQNGN